MSAVGAFLSNRSDASALAPPLPTDNTCYKDYLMTLTYIVHKPSESLIWDQIKNCVEPPMFQLWISDVLVSLGDRFH